MPSSAFLSRAKELQHRGRVEPDRNRDRLAVVLDHPTMLGHCDRVDAAEAKRHLGRVHQPDRHRLAMTEFVGACRLECVAERVAVVQDRPTSALAFVFGHDVGLDPDTGSYPIDQRQGVEVATTEEVIFRQLTQTAAVVTFGEGGERVGVAQHRARLPERSDQVLPLREVDATLSADRRVDLAEKRGGDVDHGNAAVVHRSRESTEVGDDATTDGNNNVVSGQSPSSERCCEVADDLEPLRPLAVFDGEHSMLDARVDIDADRRLGDDRDPFRGRREDFRQAAPRSGTDDHRVRAATTHINEFGSVQLRKRIIDVAA